MTEGPILRCRVKLAAIPEGGTTERLEAGEAQRRAIAEAYDLMAVETFSAEIAVTRPANGLIAVDGRVIASITQACVVSLDPVVQSIDEPISVRYTMATANQRPVDKKAGADPATDPDVEPPEVITGPTIDVAAIALEHFALAIDPYPRAPGAAFSPLGTEAPEAAVSPFAALARLREQKN